MMKTPMTTFTPGFSPVIKMMELQTKLAIETGQAMMDLAMLPWQNMPVGKMPTLPAMTAGFASICNPRGVSSAAPAAKAETVAPKAAPVVEAAPVAEPTETAPEPAAAVSDAPTAADLVVAGAMDAPELLDAAKGAADDLTVLNGVGPKLAAALNEAGIYHLNQIAGWTDANVAWVDANVAGVRGRASKGAWVAQATDLLA
ncbi:hypothetical protein [Sagittula sp. SSi028]|uniref:hypothetical protein n=1 Tax=Sagittula sp. SSi028 TaxID=3400636 RepID=UPI003AF40FFB